MAISIQEKAKEAVESMTGYEVKAVNVHVEGIKRLEKNNIDDIDKELDNKETEEKKVKGEEESKTAQDTKEADEK